MASEAPTIVSNAQPNNEFITNMNVFLDLKAQQILLKKCMNSYMTNKFERKLLRTFEVVFMEGYSV